MSKHFLLLLAIQKSDSYEIVVNDMKKRNIVFAFQKELAYITGKAIIR